MEPYEINFFYFLFFYRKDKKIGRNQKMFNEHVLFLGYLMHKR